jgi:hypothetical protein
MYNRNSLHTSGVRSYSGEPPVTAHHDIFPSQPQVYQSGSILTCFYNRKKGILSFTYNGIYLGVGFSNIPLFSDYYAAVYSTEAAAQIKLLDMTFK